MEALCANGGIEQINILNIFWSNNVSSKEFATGQSKLVGECWETSPSGSKSSGAGRDKSLQQLCVSLKIISFFT